MYMYFVVFILHLTLKVPEKLQLYGLYVYYVVHICDFGMLRVKPTPYPSYLQFELFKKIYMNILLTSFYFHFFFHFISFSWFGLEYIVCMYYYEIANNG